MCANCKHAVELPDPTTQKEAMERPADLGCDALSDPGVNPTWKTSWCSHHERKPEDLAPGPGPER